MTQSPTRVKICGLTSPEAIKGAAQAGATYGGLVFYEKSPRHLSLAKAREVALAAPPGFAKYQYCLQFHQADRFKAFASYV